VTIAAWVLVSIIGVVLLAGWAYALTRPLRTTEEYLDDLARRAARYWREGP